MVRPVVTWALFGLSFAVVLAAMGLVTVTALRLDEAESNARQQAALEENIRLALWRMDSALAPLVAQESGRPYFVYSAFYPADRAYTRMFAQVESGEILVPSPLLAWESSYIFLHFQLGPDGQISSPQAPTGNMCDLAETINKASPGQISAAAECLQQFQGQVKPADLLAAFSATSPTTVTPMPIPFESTTQPQQQAVQTDPESQYASQVQAVKNVAEWGARSECLQPSKVQQKVRTKLPPLTDPLSEIREGAVRPVWFGPALVLARRVSIHGGDYVQGCWLNWDTIRQELVSGIKDLLPNAELQPVRAADANNQARQLAAIPARLTPGPLPAVAADGHLSPIRLSLLVAWGCVALAGAAVAVLLTGVISLSERRAAFVSAVTHELRTPLTTFRLYTEMLSDGMVSDEQKRLQYLNTLRLEADRLSHLVENVLAYARLERGGISSRIETMPLSSLLAKVKDRLAERAQQAGMELNLEATPNDLSVKADPAAVDQILFNLVDNACKYAATASDRRIILRAGHTDRAAVLSVQDYGPGVSREEARRLFRPFSKSARQAANSAPGVGLGLALSRRLARSMGGDLRLDTAAGNGACFELTLPSDAVARP